MRFDLARRSLLAALLAVGTTFGAGCSLAGDDADDEETGASDDAIVDIDNSRVKRQSIGNCWLYATASWAESLAMQVSGTRELNMSESYWTYWHWFDQIANGAVSSEIQTGGWYSTAAEIITRYGIVNEGSFIPSEANDEMSLRQSSALKKINASIKSGALSTPEARRDRAVVRKELDKAFELAPNVVTQLNRVFGAGVVRTLDKSTVSTRFTSIKRAADIKVRLRDPQTKEPVTANLQDALGTRTSTWSNYRSGRYAWQPASYPWSPSSRRSMLTRLQRAMHDGQPVIMSWYVDFNALDAQGRFAAPPATPGRQGGHMVVVEDYQINDVPGFGTLKVGVKETRPEALAAALSPSAKIELIRVKNSWGSFRPDREFVLPGFHDLYMDYLDGPIQQCTQKDDDTGSTDNCWDATPLNDFIFPPGY
ncbi:MAG: hypothetical protein KF894_11765 [Labilithrix sp.]|nr:hypothetical protein [Labilithrix sp.]